MEAINQDFSIKQGSDFTRTLTFKNPDLTLMNLTGYTFKADAKVDKFSIDPDFSFVFDTTNAATGIILMKILNASTTPLDLSENCKFYYDAEMQVSGIVSRFLQGIITMSSEVTK